MSVESTKLKILKSKTSIQQFYSGQNVLITGGTGFLGKLLIEKLLRSCPDISSLYLVIRPKKDQDAHKRLDTLINDQVFDRLREENPKFRQKLKAIAGDSQLPGLGISAADRELIAREITLVFHLAATVRFDTKIKQAILINVRGTIETMELCRTIHNLKAVIYVSTAFSNCNRSYIDEKFYDPPLTGDDAIKLVTMLDNEKLDKFTKTLLGDFPNNYAYTKCIAEQVVKQYGKGMPAGVFRPAIVLSTWREPVSGWLDNVYGPAGLLVGAGTGVLRTLLFDEDCVAELIPGDYTVNALIAMAWDLVNNNNKNEEPPIYNYHSSWTEGVTWGRYMKVSQSVAEEIPPTRTIWCINVTTTKSFYVYNVLALFLHIMPALIIDSMLMITGKEAKMLKMQKKIYKFLLITSYFGTRNWQFNSPNMIGLWDKLSPEDQEEYFFSMRNFDWNNFLREMVVGLRLHICKDKPESIPMARKRLARFVLLHQTLRYMLIGLAIWVVYSLISFIITWTFYS